MINESYFHQNESYMKALEDDINYAKTPIPSLSLTELDEYKTVLSKCNESTIPLKTINFVTTIGTKTFKIFDVNREQKAITYNKKEKDKLEISEKKTKTEKKNNNNSNNINNDYEKDSPFFDDLDSCNSNKEENAPFFDDINSYF